MPRQQQAHLQRVGPEHAQARTGLTPDLGPGAQQHLQALARLVTADENDRVLTSTGVGELGHRDAVRDHLVFAGEVLVRRGGRVRRHRDPVVEPLGEEAPDRRRELHPGELARGMEGGDERHARERERRDADRRRHRLVHVQEVEALPLQHLLHPDDCAGTEDDVRQSPVRRHNYRPPDRDHVGRRLLVPAHAGVEILRQPPRRIVPDHDPRVDAEPLQGPGLVVCVLRNTAPERPRVRDDDPDLHPWG